VQGDRHLGGCIGSSSVESHIHIQHFLMPKVEDREGVEGRRCDVCVGFPSLDEVGLSNRTVCESSDVIEGAVDSS
jgi:hypothetical protein